MRFARAPFTIRTLMGLVALTAVLVGGGMLLLRYTAVTRPPLPARSRDGLIMEGVDINWRPRGEYPAPPRSLLPPELPGARHF
jgi:hypothetical protein